jgi:hypothetical protein
MSVLTPKNYKKMGNLSREIARVEAGGAKKVTAFAGAMRDVDLQTLEAGMKFTYTGSEQVYEQEFGGNKTQFVLLPVNGNADNVIPFYPSTFWKSRAEVNEDGTFTGKRPHTTGTAAEAFRACGTVQAGMEAIKGREFVIKEMNPVKCLRYGTTQVVTANIPVIDFV